MVKKTLAQAAKTESAQVQNKGVLMVEFPSHLTAILAREPSPDGKSFGQVDTLGMKPKAFAVEWAIRFLNRLVSTIKPATLLVRQGSLSFKTVEGVEDLTVYGEALLTLVPQFMGAGVKVKRLDLKGTGALQKAAKTEGLTHYVGVLGPTTGIDPWSGETLKEPKSTHYQANMGRLLNGLEGRPVDVSHYSLEWGAKRPVLLSEQEALAFWSEARRESEVFKAKQAGDRMANLDRLMGGTGTTKREHLASQEDHAAGWMHDEA